MEEEQQYLDLISSETSKLQGLKESHKIELDLRKKKAKAYADSQAANAEQSKLEMIRAEKLAFEKECSREAEEKKSLLQAVINEAQESGFPMPPSLIKLLNHTNGKLFFFLNQNLCKDHLSFCK